MMRQEPWSITLLINFLPAKSLIFFSFINFTILKISSFMLDKVVKAQHLKIVVFTFFNVFTPIDEHLSIIHNR